MDKVGGWFYKRQATAFVRSGILFAVRPWLWRAFSKNVFKDCACKYPTSWERVIDKETGIACEWRMASPTTVQLRPVLSITMPELMSLLVPKRSFSMGVKKDD